MKVVGEPVLLSEQMHTYDLEVGDVTNPFASHSYQIVVGGEGLVTHNTVSLLAGSTPGVHWPISRCYIRRVRLAKDSDLVEPLIRAGYKVEPAKWAEKSTVVVEFPIKLQEGVRSQNDVSMWEKLSLTEFLQKHWADNQVSVTIDFDPKTEGSQIASALSYFQYRLKSVSFLPRQNDVYDQMPYEAISEEVCDEMLSRLSPISFPRRVFGELKPEDKVEKDIFCDGDQCVVPARGK
jgi:ribonucleoside-triphosphate reductase